MKGAAERVLPVASRSSSCKVSRAPLGVHAGAQPAEQATEVAARYLLVEVVDIIAQAFDELHGDDGAQCIGGEVAE